MNGNACLRWLAADPPNLAEAGAAAQRIVRDATRAGEVVARVRALVKRAPAQRSTLDINEVIVETLAFTRSEAARQGVSTQTELCDDPPPLVGDRVQLQQVFVNLILNAVDAMDGVTERPRVLTIRSRPDTSRSVVVDVEDSGIGLPPSDASRIFDVFFSTKPGGLGIGLAVSRSIVELHGGSITALSNTNPGLTMRLVLPSAHRGA